ncbi:DUF2884 family protein [Xanthomonas hyacinthi]|uniref:DUF2884 domain-containing protein n=2 Tax=Xanthomonas hyacinthi TaxID=56455 RepID=A0A2S7EX09_9XANT|nr:DUF2884 domain-containing protein [Xanthomonas hyacinthi]QGY77144.1 DUF2884 family protein [Xanthomonas hyacinthi]
MRTSLLLSLLLLAARSVHAQAGEGGKQHHRLQVSSHQCGLSTQFNVLADGGGIWLYRDSGSPREVFFHNGELSVDHKVRQVGAGDAQRLREMEKEARVLMPQVADVAHAVVDVSYDALGGVVEVMTGSWLNARKIERLRKRANGYVDGTLGKGRWDQDAFDGNFEKYVEDEAEEFKGSIARHILWRMVAGRSDAMDERADKMGDELDAKLEAQREAIEAKADALCAQVEKLRQLQDALQFRYEGQPLQMLTPVQNGRRDGDVDGADDDAGPKPENGDKPRDDANKVQTIQRK